MSMDLILYTACAIGIPADLPEVPNWTNNHEFGWVYEGDSWLVRVDAGSGDDIPQEASSLMQDLNHSVSVMLEGSIEDGAEFLQAVVITVIGKCGQGVVESPTGFDRIEL